MEKINSNLLLCIFSLLFVIIIIKYNNLTFNEKFEDYFKVTAYNIIPNLNQKSYIGTFIPKDEHNYKGNLIVTNSLKSGKWSGPIKNGSPDNKSIIVDLCYNTDKRLMCVALKSINNKKIYSIYIKESNDIYSEWIKLDSNKNIMSITYDMNNRLLGCEANTGQIYRKENEDLNSSWFGPINYDIPMKKILYDRDEIMIGIGLLDNKIYKKTGIDWERTPWDKVNMNHQRVFDLLFDYDGKLLATSYDNIIKQKYETYLSDFEKYNKSYEYENVLTFEDIIKLKTGLSDKVELETEEKLKINDEFRNILKYKKKILNFCKNKNPSSGKINKMLVKTDQQNKNIDEIRELIKKLKKK